jgi:hypothetical protein
MQMLKLIFKPVNQNINIINHIINHNNIETLQTGIGIS